MMLFAAPLVLGLIYIAVGRWQVTRLFGDSENLRLLRDATRVEAYCLAANWEEPSARADGAARIPSCFPAGADSARPGRGVGGALDVALKLSVQHR